MADRKENGQFIKGTNGGPGRPKKERELRYYEIMQSKCTFKDWGEIVEGAVKQAKRGDASARTWLSNYLLGPPVQKMDLNHSGTIGVTVDWDEHDNSQS